jgi:hypothetical protein
MPCGEADVGSRAMLRNLRRSRRAHKPDRHAARAYSCSSPPRRSRRRTCTGVVFGNAISSPGEFWCRKAKCSVRALAVVVVDVDVERPLELPSAKDEKPVQALLTDRAHPALGVSVCVGRLDRCLDHADALRPENLIDA